MNLTPDWSLLVILAIFIANYFVVRAFFLKPINGVLVAREQEILGAEAVFEESMARFHEATSEMEARLIEARRKGSSIREARRSEAAATRAELIAETRQKAEGLTESAEQSLRADVVTAREKIERESEALARLAAEKILGRQLA